MNMKLIGLQEYMDSVLEDFENPFAEDKGEKKPVHISDKGGSFETRKESFNLARVEWSKRPGGDYTVIAKTIDRLKDIIFEINKDKGEWGLVLGYGSLYRHSNKPNVDYAYNKRQRHMFFLANKTIQMNEELTIDYGSEYWQERSNLDTMAEIPNVSTVKEPDASAGPEIEESVVQPTASDMESGKTDKQFGEPNSRANPAISGIAIKGGQS